MKYLKKINLGVLSLGLIAVAFSLFILMSYISPKSEVVLRLPSQISDQPGLEQGETWTPQDSSNAEQITQRISDSLDHSTANGKIMKRDAHPKHHGCVIANFEVDTKLLPASQQVGIFAPNQPKVFQAWIRFSNGDPDSTKPDAEGDVRGMAIKLMNVKNSVSGTQDFLLMNSKSFFIRDSDEYLDLMEALENNFSIILFAAFRPRFRAVIGAARSMKVGSPLDIDYFSATPYKLGNTAVKWAAKSCPSPNKNSLPQNPTANFLGEKLADTLAQNEACFDFQVQLRNTNAHMPIEDSTVEWNENQSRYFTIAKIKIPKQTEIRSEERMRFCENLSFNPWKTLPEQRPLGAINRIRLLTYKHIS
ncbi:MAG: catalase, partial [Pseudobdellovibrionaceae bacterium]